MYIDRRYGFKTLKYKGIFNEDLYCNFLLIFFFTKYFLSCIYLDIVSV